MNRPVKTSERSSQDFPANIVGDVSCRCPGFGSKRRLKTDDAYT